MQLKLGSKGTGGDLDFVVMRCSGVALMEGTCS